jgi:hypothetical protein
VSGLSVGKLIYLDQNDETADGFPATGDTVFASDGAFSYQGGDTFKRPNKGQLFISVVTGISGNDVTMRHGIVGQTWRSGAGPDPEAYWCTAGASITNVGIENMSMDFTGIGNNFGMMVYDAYDCWVTGCRVIQTNITSSCCFSYVRMIQTCNITVANNYFWGPEDGSGASGINHYGIVHGADAFSLVANNIVYNNPGQFEFNGVNIGGVLAYNYGRLTWFNSFADHDKGSQFYLIEGNDVTGFTADITHGISAFGTLFRSRFAGDNTGATDDTCVWIQPYHRFYNMIGCVIGNSGNGSYESSAVNNNLGDVEIHLGGSDTSTTTTGGHSQPATDTRVKDTLFRWGNWDFFNNDVRFVSSEVPSGIANFANAEPASQTLPNSLFYTAQPDFWGTTYGTSPWPVMGPDVSSGTNGLDGRMHLIPARRVFESLPVDPEYSIQGIQEFNATNYFASSAASQDTRPGSKVRLRGIRLK